MKSYFKSAVFLLGESYQQIPKIILFFILISILDLVSIGIIGPFLGVVFGGIDTLPQSVLDFLNLSHYNRVELVSALATVMIFIYLFKSILGIFIMRYVIEFSQNQQVHLRRKLISSYQKMPYSFMIQRNSSDYINAIQFMVPNYANLVMFSLQALGDCIVAIVIITFLAWTNLYVLGFLVLITGICLVGFDLLIRKRISVAGQKANESSSLIVRFTNESLQGFKEIRVLKQEKYFNDNLNENSKILAAAQTLINFYSIVPKYLFEMIIIIFIGVVSIVSIQLYDDPVQLIPTLGVFAMASVRIIPVAKNFSFTLSRIRFSKHTVLKLANDLENVVLATKDTVLDQLSSDQTEIDNIKTIKLKDVSYTYPSTSTASLNDINLEINEGEHIGIIGTSGAGKTTLVDTLLGLLSPSKGQIFVNDLDITNSPEILWENVAYLPQEIFIIDGSVKQNIALGIPEVEINDVQLAAALKQAQIEDVILNLSDGINTNIGEKGVKLSGGQRQRIALARAFYFNRRILVLDEATSSLDMKTETQIINFLKNMKKKITVISITHRAKSLEHCDRILTIDNGRIKQNIS